MTALTVNDLSTATLKGDGVFDVLMRSVKAHLDAEFTAGRIKGPEYSTVYLGSLDQAMQTALTFLLQSRKQDKELALLDKQIEVATVEVQKTNAELLILQANKDKIPAEILHIQAQTRLTDQQKLNGEKENLVLVAQECKLKAEFDLTESTTRKSEQEISLLAQKTATERAQITALGVDDNSVVGRQKSLYKAQTDGFLRDAEQKAAKLLADTWSVRRTTDEGTVADGTNMLNDATIGRSIQKLLAGVGA